MPQAHDVALALTFGGQGAQPFRAELVALGWTEEAARVLAAMQSGAVAPRGTSQEEGEGALSLPFVSLRTRLQLQQAGWVEMRRDVALRWPSSAAQSAFGHVQANCFDIETVHDVLGVWINQPLAHFAQKFGVAAASVERMRSLLRSRQILRVSHRNVTLFPWPTVGESEVYSVGPGQLAMLLAGRELFEGLGPMIRIVGDAQNDAQLMTAPQVAGGGSYSLVCELKLETLPGAAEAIVHVKFRRRRWATQLEANPFGIRRIGGFVHAPQSHPDIAFSFGMVRDSRGWKADAAFDDLDHHLGLQVGERDESLLAARCVGDAKVLVMHKAGVAEAEGSSLEAGVPAADQYFAFERVTGALTEHGFAPFGEFAPVRLRGRTVPRLSVLRPAIVLGRLLADDGDEAATQTPSDIDQHVVELTQRPLREWFGRNVPEMERLNARCSFVRDWLQRCGLSTLGARRTLYVVMQSDEELQWARALVDVMVGDLLEVKFAPLPAKVHGARESLPHADGDRKKRIAARCEAWESFAGSIKTARPMFLIQASDWYTVANRPRRDDSVNKVAARRFLATRTGGTVQYLLPWKGAKLEKYLMRLQAAILDLVFGHGGPVVGLADAAAQCFDDATRPLVVAALGSVSVEVMGMKSRTVLAATKISIETGLPQMRIAHQEHAPVITEWMDLDKAMQYVASRERLELGNREQTRELFAQLATQTLRDVAKEDPRAVVFVDSTRIASYWRSMTDKAAGGSFELGASWEAGWQALRIVRVRDRAPMLVTVKELSADDEVIRCVTSVQRLFRIDRGASRPTYWSVSRPFTQHKRGTSCFRPMRLSDGKGGVAMFPADHGQHQTPRATELAIMQCAPTDDPDRLAAFAQMLRAGIPQARGDVWVKTPSPLFVIEKLRDYME